MAAITIILTPATIAGHDRRAEMVAEHRTYLQGLLWTLANHPRVPLNGRERLDGWGYALDEFVEHDHLSPQLYVREARRMVGAAPFVMALALSRILGKSARLYAMHSRDR